jgi:hypothetical protein
MTFSRPGCPPSSCCCNGAPSYNHFNETLVHITRFDREDFGVQELDVIATVGVLPPMPCQVVHADMPVVFFHPGLDTPTGLSNMDLTTGTGMPYTPMVFSPSLSSTRCSNWISSWATAHIFYAESGQQLASAVEG